jgi:Domain of unknown function (DUF4331)
MSSHREAPEISKDPVTDSTDVYAFVSPDKPAMVSLIANYIPFEDPAGAPNFYEFGDDVLYRINIDNNGDAVADIVFEFRFTTEVTNPDSFLYNTGQVTSLTDSTLNRRQFFSLTKYSVVADRRHRTKTITEKLVRHAPVVPCNVGPRSMPDYPALAASSVVRLADGSGVFAGQRLDAFFVDIGAIFDLGDLRPFQNLHLISTMAAAGVNNLRGFNVHSLALEVPIASVTCTRTRETDVDSPNAVLGVWTTASRFKATVRGQPTRSLSKSQTGPFVQVSRLGNPLINEAVIPMSRKDEWNKSAPAGDAAFAEYGLQPELAKLLPVLYPGVFPNLAAYTADRADLAAILFTGVPSGVIPGFQNFSGPTIADMLRLNVAIPPSSSPNILGIVGGDLAGFPNGRRVVDDVVTVELRAIAGATIPFVDPSFTPDGAASLITDGSSGDQNATLATFPWLGDPISGFDTVPPTVSTAA